MQQPQLTTEADATNLSASEDPTVTGDRGHLVIENGSSALGTGGSDLPANSPDMERKAREMAMKLMRPLTPEERIVIINATTGPALSDEQQNIGVATPQDDASVEVMGEKSPATTDGLIKFTFHKQSVSGGTRSGKSPSSLVNLLTKAPIESTEAESKTLLVYPFDAEEAQLSKAASELKELGGDLLGFDDHGTPLNLMIISPNNRARNIGREHCITVGEDDKTRLEKGIWVNDTLVDLWMRW